MFNNAVKKPTGSAGFRFAITGGFLTAANKDMNNGLKVPLQDQRGSSKRHTPHFLFLFGPVIAELKYKILV